MQTLKTLLKFGIIIFSFIFITSCSQEETESDTEKPTIHVEEPSMNDTIVLAQSPEIHIEFTAQDNVELKQVSVKLTNSIGTELFAENPSVAGLKVFSFHDHYMPTGITTLTPLTVTIVTTDKKDNSHTMVIPIVVKP